MLVIIISIRFFGLFIVLPVISLYAQSFENISALMVGLIIGGAYLTQLLFQTPLGILSDRYNRKIIIFIGLAIFLLGSVICAFAKTPEWLVVGRLIQGMGAVGGIVSAQITDITREEQRTKAMAVMGGCIFASFILAMIVGPIIGGHIGASWLFGITALFTFCSILLLYKVPQSPKLTYSFDTKENTPKETRNKNLWIMNLSSFLEKALMTLVFVVVPLISFDHFHIIEQDLWKIYVPSAILAIFAMGPASILAEKYNKPKLVLFLGISCFLLAYLLFAYSENILWMFVCGILIFFVGFAMLEPIMQSLASKYAKAHLRGRALGNFTTASYLGSFVGGMFGAFAYHHLNFRVLAWMIAVLCILWIGIIFFLRPPQKQKNLYLPLEENLRKILSLIGGLQGVIEVYINEGEKILIIKYDTDLIHAEQLEQQISELGKSHGKISN